MRLSALTSPFVVMLLIGCGPEDACPEDDAKELPGQCGCGVADDDSDGDDWPDCFDLCPEDSAKIGPGVCGCGEPDDDLDGDGFIGCVDVCPDLADVDQADRDQDGVGDACDNCLRVPNADQADADADGVGDLCWCDPRPADCVDGFAGGFACEGVDLVGRVPFDELVYGWNEQMDFTTQRVSDVWGWVEPTSGREFALVGIYEGTLAYEVTNPYCPELVGVLRSATDGSNWRDIRVWDDYAYIVSEAGRHGLQVLDLTRLLDPDPVWPLLEADGRLDTFGSAHNISLNTDTGRAWIVGSDQCSGGLYTLDLSDPLDPDPVGCFGGFGYAHDVQCVTYGGPDTEHVGKEVCVASTGRGGALGIVDMSDPAAPVVISQTPYPEARYSHQGWLSEDHRWFFHGDELDELAFRSQTRTFVWDLTDLDAPVLSLEHEGRTLAIDHNQFVHEGRLYQANYRAGLDILDVSDVEGQGLVQAGYFDTTPLLSSRGFDGVWGVYPYLPSGNVVVTSIREGLFVLREQEQE